MAPKGAALYKKQDGTLALSGNSVIWTSVAPGSKPGLSLAVSSITNLQQTPANSSKVMLKIFVGSETYVFTFTATDARAEADAIKDALSKAILAVKVASPAPATADGSNSNGIVPSAVRNASKSMYDDERLLSNLHLQQSLLKSNPSLSKTFMESLRTKPDAISSSQFAFQFWASRLHLLRAHAIEQDQSRGQYNVLSTIKPRNEDNQIKLSVGKEQIQLIFSQHPLVKRVYDENVPKLTEEAFWSQFFQSRLFKKLKGERIAEADAKNSMLDKYLDQEEDVTREQRMLESHVPRFMDLEGNEVNHSQRKGNAPDLLMRPSRIDKVPIIRTLNSLSEKIIAHVAPSDMNPSEPIGMDEETFNQLQLRDLRGDAAENRVILNIKDQGRFFSNDKESEESVDARLFSKQDPKQVLRRLRADLSTATHQPLATNLGIDSDSDSDEETSKPSHPGSKSATRSATKQVFLLIDDQRTQNQDNSNSGTFNTIPTAAGTTLPPVIFDRLALTHATTTEFLSHFWAAFLSGNPARAEEVAKLVETLNRAMDRINAVADDAEVERGKEIQEMKEKVRAHYERTGRKVAFDPESIKGGKKVVDRLMLPTIKAIGRAIRKYQDALNLAEMENSQRES